MPYSGRRLLLFEIALHRVTELVRQRADVAERAVVIDQHVSVDVVGAAVRVRAGRLPFVREQIDPAIVEGALDGGLILLPERRDRGKHVLLRFFG
jgi:hypothetical protein